MSTASKTLLPPPSPSRKLSAATMVGAVISAFLASACCIGPLLLALVGLGGAGLLIKLEPYRPYFTVVTLAALGAGFWFTYRKPKVVEGDDCGCEHPKSNRIGKVLLWVVAVLVIGFWSFPYVAEKLLG
jgi:mercuric ion transport protein